MNLGNAANAASQASTAASGASAASSAGKVAGSAGSNPGMSNASSSLDTVDSMPGGQTNANGQKDNPLSEMTEMLQKTPDKQLKPKMKENPDSNGGMPTEVEMSRDDAENLVDLIEEMPEGGEIDLGETEAEAEGGGVTTTSSGNTSGGTSNSGEQETEDGKKVFQDENGQEFKEGDKVEPGKEVDENGQVKDSSTKKMTKAAGRAVAAYFTGGESIGNDKQLLNLKPVDQAVGVASDIAEKTPGVKQVADELEEAGVSDGVNDILDTVGDIKNGDYASAAENAEKVKEDVKKLHKHTVKRTLQAILISSIPTLFVLIITIAVIGPVIGGFIDITDKIGEAIEGVVEGIGDFFDNLFGGNSPDFAITEWVTDFNSLSLEKQRIVVAAASLVGGKYQWGGKPNAAGLSGVPSTGLDCSGYVQWVLWTAYGINPGMLSTGVIADLANKGDRFVIVSEDELEPGDIGLIHMGPSSENHTGIYAGNGYWFHAAGASQGIIRSKYTGFKYYLRYVSPASAAVTGEVATWRQYDSSWGGIYMGGSGKTIKQIGCLVTAIAIQITRSGVSNPIVPFNPGTFVQALNKNGGFTSGGGLYWGVVTKVVPNFKYMGQISLSGKTQADKLQTIGSYLSQGYYVVTEVKGNTGQHWVAVVSTSSAGVTMIDPASNSIDMWGQYNWANTSALSYFKVA